MPTFNTLFKKIYEEALAPYGFVKMKGKNPYFVRLIGDEIIHVITYRNQQTGTSLKAFNILGGVATVYRGALTLELSPNRNSIWMAQNNHIYAELHPYETEEEKRYRISILDFEYEKDNEDSMVKSLRNSLEVTKKIMLPELDKAVDLKSSLEYIRMYTIDPLYTYTDEDFGKSRGGYESDEGYLQLKVYDTKEYEEIRKKAYEESFRYELYQIEAGISGRTNEKLEKERKLLDRELSEIIERFKFLKNDPEQYTRIMQELERRKEANTQRLREYGFKL